MDCEEDSRETETERQTVQLNLEACWGLSVCLCFVVVFLFRSGITCFSQELLLKVCSQATWFFFFLLKYFYVSIWFTVQFYLFMVYCFSVLACWAKHLQILLVLYSPFTHDSSLLYKESRVFHTWFIPKLIPNMSHDLWPSYPGIGQNIKLFTKTEDAIKSLVKSNFSLCVFIFVCITYGICVQFCNTVLGY